MTCGFALPRMELEPKEPDVTPAAVTPGVEPARDSSWGQRELMLVAAALVGSGAITLGMLSAGGATTSAAPGPVRTTPSTPAPAADTPSSSTSHWVENTATWTGRTRKSAAFELPARNETQVWMKTVRPLLVVRCVNGRTDAFVFTDSPAAMEAQDEDHAVRISFDGDEGRTERWPDSSEHDALFAPDGTAFAARLKQARTLRFGYTPHNSSPVVAHFDLPGLGHKLAAAPAACGK